MPRSRKVTFQGETYDDPEAVRDAVDKLLAQAQELDEDDSERAKLIEHAVGLEDAVREVFGEEAAGARTSEDSTAGASEGDAGAAEADRPGEPEAARDDPPEGMRWCPLCDGGGVVPTILQQDPTTTTCTDCGGLGIVYTGALVEDSSQRTCTRCRGAGYLVRLRAASPAADVAGWQAPGVEQAEPPALVEAGSNGDEWVAPAQAEEAFEPYQPPAS